MGDSEGAEEATAGQVVCRGRLQFVVRRYSMHRCASKACLIRVRFGNATSINIIQKPVTRETQARVVSQKGKEERAARRRPLLASSVRRCPIIQTWKPPNNFSEMYARTPHQRKSRSTTKPDYDFLVLPELGLFVKYGEAKSVELKRNVCQLDVLRQKWVAQD